MATSPTSRHDPLGGHRRALLAAFEAALAAVNGRTAVAGCLHRTAAPGQVTLVAVGKAAQSMALGALDAWGPAIAGGLVIGKGGHLDAALLAGHGLDAVEGGHPLPDAGSVEAGRRLLELLEALPPARPLLLLISGGASALVEVPVPGLRMEDLQCANRWLLGSGLDIARMNRVRKALSRIKAGGLLRWIGKRPVRALLISDVPGDDPAVIGSALLVPDAGPGPEPDPVLPPWLAAAVAAGLRDRAAGPMPAASVLEIVARLDDARRAAAAQGGRLGYGVELHPEPVVGDAADAAARLVETLREGPPALHVWGGETAVRLPPCPGRGGRNQHLALAAARLMRGRDDLLLLCAGTDGTDGPTEDAGALVDGGTVARAGAEGFDADDCLARADSGSLLEASGDLVHTGPTGTNVMDLMLGLRIAGPPVEGPRG